MIAPVGYETLAAPQSRRSYLKALAANGAGSHPRLIVKIEAMPAGVTPMRVAEITTYIRTRAKQVVMEMPRADTALFEAGRLGLVGLSLRAPADTTAAAFAKSCQALVRSAAMQHASSFVDGIGDERIAAMAQAYQVQYASGWAMQVCPFTPPAAEGPDH